jgi:hypothetical protein
MGLVANATPYPILREEDLLASIQMVASSRRQQQLPSNAAAKHLPPVSLPKDFYTRQPPLYPVSIVLYEKNTIFDDNKKPLGEFILSADHSLSLLNCRNEVRGRVISCWQALKRQEVLYVVDHDNKTRPIRRSHRDYPKALLLVLGRVFEFDVKFE